jgi:hypothetical protein
MAPTETKTGASRFDNECIKNDRHFLDAEGKNNEECRFSIIENDCRYLARYIALSIKA